MSERDLAAKRLLAVTEEELQRIVLDINVRWLDSFHMYFFKPEVFNQSLPHLLAKKDGLFKTVFGDIYKN